MTAAVLILVLWGQDTFVKIGDNAYLTGERFASVPTSRIKHLIYPTLGCPSIVKRETIASLRVRLANGGASTDFEVRLKATGEALVQIYGCPVVSVTYDGGIYSVNYFIPFAVPEDMYDVRVVVPSASLTDAQPNSLKVVGEFPAEVRFATISDSHFDAPTGFWHPRNLNLGGFNPTTIVPQMLHELKHQSIDFAIVSGDLVFGMDYSYEYEGAWEIFKSAGFPLFMVPGNHDAYASVKKRSVLGITCPKRDGLDFYRSYFGPTHYSFNYGGWHFLGVNSADGTAQRRDGFYIVVENYGGDLSPEQQQFVEQDLAPYSSNVIAWMHHAPIGPYRPNGTFAFARTTLGYIVNFIRYGGVQGKGQTWNNEAAGQWIASKLIGRSPYVSVGHEHYDRVLTQGGTVWKWVTTCSAASSTYWGYGLTWLADGQVKEYLYEDVAHQSVPSGNLFVNFKTPNDGSSSEVGFEIQSGLSKELPMLIKVVVRRATSGLSVYGGSIVRTKNLAHNRTKLWIRTTSPPGQIHMPQTRAVWVIAH